MQTQNRILEDLARVASSAMGVAAGMRGEVEARLREQFERILSQMDLVPREEFEAVKAVAVKAREEQEVLAERLAKLEAELAPVSGTRKPARKRAPAKKKANPASGGLTRSGLQGSTIHRFFLKARRGAPIPCCAPDSKLAPYI